MPVIDDRHPETLEGLKELFLQKGEEYGEAHEAYYERESNRLVTEFKNTGFWTEFGIRLDHLSERRQLEGEFPVLAHGREPAVIEPKPWDSLLDKCYRKNVLENEVFPNSPPEGWITEKNWLDRIHDVVRTTVVVRYMDDIFTVAKLLQEVAADEGIEIDVNFKARNEGYYAVHVSVPMRLQYAESGWEPLFANIQVEIQLCTQIQEVIRSLTHVFYMKRRVRPREPGHEWQWNCESDEFVPNYLGHMLQYADGMIMNSRLAMSDG